MPILSGDRPEPIAVTFAMALPTVCEAQSDTLGERTMWTKLTALNRSNRLPVHQSRAVSVRIVGKTGREEPREGIVNYVDNP